MSKPTQQALFDAAPPLAGAPAFIEQQFPVAKLSAESFKERKANNGQTLNSLGRWWGRKPLILVRAALLGLLMPASDDPVRDREIFLKLLTMDEQGLQRRRSKSIPGARLLAELPLTPPNVRRRFLDPDAPADAPRLRPRLSREDRAELQALVFERMPYAEKIEYCDRPEQIAGPSVDAWAEINAHLGTEATNLPELATQLGLLRFGHVPRVGDAFCGGGSVPFEAARIGCDAYGSDLNPVAALLTWAGMNIVGGGPAIVTEVEQAQRTVFAAVDEQIKAWGIEQNEQGWRADTYFYCLEVKDPETGWLVPLAATWVLGERSRTIAKLVPDYTGKCYDIEILQGASSEEMAEAKELATVKNSRITHKSGNQPIPIDVIRRNMRLWEKSNVSPHDNDALQERLFCIRWVESVYDESGKVISERRHYRAPTSADFQREKLILGLLEERLSKWQAEGYIPDLRIEPGVKTNELIRTRGWTYWHHLFTPRQLLVAGFLAAKADQLAVSTPARVELILALGRCVAYMSRLSMWHKAAANENVERALTSQALNPLFVFASRGWTALRDNFCLQHNFSFVTGESYITTANASQITNTLDCWITDPPYADAVSYEEISEFFLSWYAKRIGRIFPDWSLDSCRALAVKRNDQRFRQSMVECYRNLTEHMPDDGFQVVMFTHQDTEVWADLTMILWAAGLRVSVAWCIATETESSLKQGNYVQGTVLLVLRKRTEAEPVFLDEITHRVELEVRCQLDEMLRIEDASEPNFADADYQLAAYAAALRVLTERPIAEIDPAREIARERKRGEVSPVEQLIRSAVKIACDHLVPGGLDRELWKSLTPMERFYLKGLEVESHGEHRSGVYQELARGFGAAEYTELFASTRANETRLMNASELKRRQRGVFGTSLVRQALYAISLTVEREDARDGLNWLKTELPDYWPNREKLIHILEYLAVLGNVSTMPHWCADAAAAAVVAGAVRNDHI
ncbi:anti-phage-associated DUF1156 domain-containing protein [Candidatus Chloroploca sp. Khr17]|uniref:anti-phage-associated DUF1156 domain-containing protein n=1 Tax=Candidatus Chloroploca sp. Khr17 TaxID=2496869 RepID=UPI00101B5FAF|nr:anti-phage-associated DUF1156 domain-containing protein [Candidatus Chloroploca sp. Khr17]